MVLEKGQKTQLAAKTTTRTTDLVKLQHNTINNKGQAFFSFN
jgi:hypothetical protein